MGYVESVSISGRRAHNLDLDSNLNLPNFTFTRLMWRMFPSAQRGVRSWVAGVLLLQRLQLTIKGLFLSGGGETTARPSPRQSCQPFSLNRRSSCQKSKAFSWKESSSSLPSARGIPSCQQSYAFRLATFFSFILVLFCFFLVLVNNSTHSPSLLCLFGEEEYCLIDWNSYLRFAFFCRLHHIFATVSLLIMSVLQFTTWGKQN